MRLFLFGLLLILSHFTFAQYPCSDSYFINFDDGQCMWGVSIDTLSDPNNTWQIGPPQKTTFTNAESAPIVIVTDTVNSYPVNDTSSFILSHIAGSGFYYSFYAHISGAYWVNSDSLNDVGFIELSGDNGVTWYDIINDNAFAGCWWSNIPTLTGNSSGWQYFNFDALCAGSIIGIVSGDTLQYRFTFLSDSVADTLDGLMFDSFIIEDYIEGLEELQKGTVKLERIIDLMGQETEDKPNTVLIYMYSDGTTEKVFRATL